MDSEVWTEDLTAFDAVEDQAAYTLAPSAGEIDRINEVKLDEGVINPIGYKLVDTVTLTFEENYVPSEDSTDGLEVNVTLFPAIDGISGPAWILNRWADEIVAGAQMYLYAQTGRPWGLPQSAALWQVAKREFEGGIGDACVVKRQKRTTRPDGFRAFSA